MQQVVGAVVERLQAQPGHAQRAGGLPSRAASRVEGGWAGGQSGRARRLRIVTGALSSQLCSCSLSPPTVNRPASSPCFCLCTACLQGLQLDVEAALEHVLRRTDIDPTKVGVTCLSLPAIAPALHA